MPIDDLYFSEGDRSRPTARNGRGKRWRVRYQDDQGHGRAKLFANWPEADAFDKAVHTDVSRGQFIDPNGGRVAFREYAEQWRANQIVRATTRVKLDGCLDRHILPALFADRSLASIRRSDIQAWVSRLSVKLAPGTVEVVYRYIAAIFKAAVNDRLIAITPCVDVKLPRKAHGRVEPLPVDLVHALAAEIAPRYRGLIYVGATAGLRQGEALGLEVNRVDFLRRTLRVDQQLVTLPGQAPMLTLPKTASSVRTLPISEFLVDALARHLAEFPAREVTLVDSTGSKPITRTARLMFGTAHGQPIGRSNMGSSFRPALVKARIAFTAAAGDDPAAAMEAEMIADRFADASYHDLRHFFASLLIAEGATVKEVQEALGHAKASLTLDVYAHLFPGSDDRTRDAVDRVMRGTSSVASSRPKRTAI